MVLAGIDFGSKLSGFTAIALFDGRKVRLINSIKGKDADKVITSTFEDSREGIIAIDAPLSLPLKYSQPEKSQDYFYRICDKELSAMSPMFIGGLTARAMKQAEFLRKKGLEVCESYPKEIARELGIDMSLYKKATASISSCLKELYPQSDLPIEELTLKTWHEFDAVLCLISAWRISIGKAKTYGQEEEGLIYI